MLFNSYIFILFFLPVTITGYYLLNCIEEKVAKNHCSYCMGKVWLIGMSLWFYGYNNPSYLPVILLSIVLNYGISKGIEKSCEVAGTVTDEDVVSAGAWTGDEKAVSVGAGTDDENVSACAGTAAWGKLLLGLGIAGNLGSIFWFKYYDFFLSNVNALFRQNFNYVNLVLPLGISFFTFQQISYLIETYRGETKGYTFIDYALFVVFFPQLVAGPIVLHKEMIPQFQDASKKHLSADHMAKALFIFSLGLFKKVILADTFGEAVDWAFDTAVDISTLEAFAVSLFYTFQLYFDFSGYCDMAVGIGEFFQIHLPQNFNSPYKATSIVDFWSRWHMTLTRFLRSYVYFPLGGSKKGAVRTYLNIMIVFLVSGLWHGANWTFVLWGLLHGLFQCLTRLGKRWWDKLFVGLRWLITFLFVDITWMLFRANDVKQAWLYIKHLFVWIYPTVWRDPIVTPFDLEEFQLIELHVKPLETLVGNVRGVHAMFFVAVSLAIVLLGKNSFEYRFRKNLWNALVTVFLLVYGILGLAGVSSFLYFNF